MFNFNHLYYFYVTAKSANATLAAQHLKISQPSLSSQLKVLEDVLGMNLFRRVGRKNQLTEVGYRVFGFCRRMFEISEELSELMLEREPSVARRINIGVSDQVERSFVVEVVSVFLRKHGLERCPKVTMVSGSHEQLVERLRFRELDAVVSELNLIDPELMSLMRTESPVVLVQSTAKKSFSSNLKTKVKGKKSRIANEVLALVGGPKAQWVMPSGRTKLRNEIDMYFETHSLKGRTVFESDVVASLVRSVEDGLGVAFLPSLYIAKDLSKKSLRILGPKEGYWRYSIWLGCHSQNHEDILIQALASSFKEISDLALSTLS